MNYQTALATRQHEAAVAQTQRADLRDAVTSLIHYQGICDRRRETIQEREQDLESAVANARKTVNREFNNHYDKIEGKYGKELSDYNSKQRTKLTRILGAAAAIALAAASGVGLYALNVTVDADFTETNQKIEKVDETASAARSAATTAAGVANEAMARSKDYQRALTGLVDSKD